MMSKKTKVSTLLPKHEQILKKRGPLTEEEVFELQKRELQLLKAQLELVEGLPHLYAFKWYPWAREFFESRNRENLLCAANQISKSSTQIRKVIHWATSPEIWHELWPSLMPGQVPNCFWYLMPTADLAQAEFESKWEPLFLPRGKFKDDSKYGWEAVYDKGLIKKIEFKTGVTVYFKSYSQKIKDLQSSSVYAIFGDEEMPLEFVPELKARLNATDGYFHLVFTATLGQLYWEEAMSPPVKSMERYPHAWKRTVSVYDCQFYEDGTPSHWTDAKIKRAIANCPTKADIDRRIFGKFVKTEGLRFPSFDMERNTCPFAPIPKHWLHFGAVDPGTGGATGHPAALGFIAVSPDYKHGRVWRCWRGDGISTASPDILSKYRELRGSLAMTGQAYDWASKEFFLHAAAKGEAFTPADKDRDSGFSLLNTLFKTGMLKVMIGDPDGETDKLVTEIRTLSATGDKRKAQDDLCDFARYCVKLIPWNFEDSDLVDSETFKDKPKPPEKSSQQQRRDWFMGIGEPAEDSVESELAFWDNFAND